MHYDNERGMNKQLSVHQKPRGQVNWTREQMKELLSYHGKGLTTGEVASLMRLDVGRVKMKAFNLGVSLNGKKG